jgi:hypothetical protein
VRSSIEALQSIFEGVVSDVLFKELVFSVLTLAKNENQLSENTENEQLMTVLVTTDHLYDISIRYYKDLKLKLFEKLKERDVILPEEEYP